MNSESGFLLHERVFSEQECFQLGATLDSSLFNRSRAGARHLLAEPYVHEFAHDPRLLAIAQGVLGPSAVPFRATLFEKSGGSNWSVGWHQDTTLPIATPFQAAGWGPWSVKEGIHYTQAPAWAMDRVLAIRIFIDPSKTDNGPLRVIKGSHALGILPSDKIFEKVRKEQPVECLGGRGDVVAMRPLLIHSSRKAISTQPRRVLHFEYVDSLDLSPAIRLAIA